jgi:predicted N-acetyltransferase YhbS
MQIRSLERQDFEQVTALGKLFAAESGLIPWNANPIDDVHVHRMLYYTMTQGISLVAVENDVIVAMLLSARSPDTWIPSVLRLRELAWWVAPEYRRTGVGIDIFTEWCRRAEEQRAAGVIASYSVGHYAHSPEVAVKLIQSKGFKFLESTYSIGEY